MINSDNMFVAKTVDGEELSFYIIFTITNSLGAKNIVYFTDNKKNEQGLTNVYCKYFVIENNQMKIINEMTDEDFKELSALYNNIISTSDDNIGMGNSSVTENPYANIEVL